MSKENKKKAIRAVGQVLTKGATNLLRNKFARAIQEPELLAFANSRLDDLEELISILTSGAGDIHGQKAEFAKRLAERMKAQTLALVLATLDNIADKQRKGQIVSDVLDAFKDVPENGLPENDLS
jgi:hypothetical protein